MQFVPCEKLNYNTNTVNDNNNLFSPFQGVFVKKSSSLCVCEQNE